MEANDVRWKRNVDDVSLNQRARVLQESLLSPRTLHFAKTQLFQSRNRARAYESFPGSFQGFPSIEDVVPGIHFGRHPISRDATLRWDDIVQRYSKARLTRETDKLVAISGIAHWRRILPKESTLLTYGTTNFLLICCGK
jgi:hypothetical protein